jgi:crotonobetainyl-CoA:carnitine CoA-transferase CaiB-like acyl-CoA transferase
MGQPALADDPRFAGATERSAHHEDIDDLIARWTSTRPLAELERVLGEAGVPATRIFTIADIFGDPHYRARGSIAQAADSDFGTVAMANVVPRLSATPGAIRHAGHRIGEDTRRVLGERLGLASQALDELERAGVIGSRTAATAETDAVQ